MPLTPNNVHDMDTLPRRTFLTGMATLGAAAMVAARPTTLLARTLGHGSFGLSGGTGASASHRTPVDALDRLLAGNVRFARGTPEAPHRDLQRLREIEAKQTPFAAVLGCADSRVPVEILFDQGFGDIFPVRVAGNVVTPEVIASLEFGTAVLGAEVLLVLGHTKCGAVKATVDGASVPGQISSLFYHIQPAVDAAKGDLGAAVVENVRRQAELLRRSSPVLTALVRERKLRIEGGVFDLATGVVTLIAP
jgi:carbonic anhydrase